MATNAPVRETPPPPDIIQERWRGIMWGVQRDEIHGYLGINSETWEQLDTVLTDIVARMFQHDIAANVDKLVERLHNVIEETIVEGVSTDGSAEWSGRRESAA